MPVLMSLLPDERFAESAIGGLAGPAGKPYVADIVAAATTVQLRAAAARALRAIGDTAALTKVVAQLAGGDPAASEADRARNRIGALPVLTELAAGFPHAVDDTVAGLAAYVPAALAAAPVDVVLLARVIEIVEARYVRVVADQGALASYVTTAVTNKDGKTRAAAVRIAAMLAGDAPSAKLVATVRGLVHDRDPDVAAEAASFVGAHP